MRRANVAGAAFVGFSSAPCVLRPRVGTAKARPQRLLQTRLPTRCGIHVTATAAAAVLTAANGFGGLAAAVQHALFEPLFAPLDACTPTAARTLAWLNFRVAVVLYVATPLYLFGGALARGPHTPAGDALTRVMAGYWQSSALLLVAVLQHAAHIPVAAGAGLLVQAVIALSLNWWKDLLGEIGEIDEPLETAFRAWRPLATVAAVVGVAIQFPFQRCNFIQPNSGADCACSAWTEPPVRLFELLGGVPSDLLAVVGNAGCAIYLAYLAYYLIVALPRIGRQGRKQRNFFTALSVLLWTGIAVPRKEIKK